MTTRRGFLEKAGAFVGGVVATKLVSRDAIPAPKIELPTLDDRPFILDPMLSSQDSFGRITSSRTIVIRL